jgi:hypothetical protein
VASQLQSASTRHEAEQPSAGAALGDGVAVVAALALVDVAVAAQIGAGRQVVAEVAGARLAVAAVVDVFADDVAAPVGAQAQALVAVGGLLAGAAGAGEQARRAQENRHQFLHTVTSPFGNAGL